MPLMPAREPRPEPLARARARLEFDTLVRNRLAAIRAGTGASHEGDPDRGVPPEPVGEQLDALARTFADEVDRENSSRGILRVGMPVDYVDAVVITGEAGALVVDSTEYDGAPLYWHAKAGRPDSVIRGRDLDGYLRTGERRYAEQIGLA